MSTGWRVAAVLLVVACSGAAAATPGQEWQPLAAIDRLSTQGCAQACTPDRPFRCPSGMCGRGPGDCPTPLSPTPYEK